MDYRVVQMDEHTWRIEEFDDTSSVYMYLLEGSERAMLLDSGLGMIPLDEITAELTLLPVDVLATHAHLDHIGGNSFFEKGFINELDREVFSLHCDKFRSHYPDYQFRGQRDNIIWYTGEKECQLGGRTLRLVSSPGHTLGAVSILDVERKWLFTGDTCCQASVLLNLEYTTTVETYKRTIERLLSIGEQYDLTWPAHHKIPVSPEILEQFREAADLLLDKKAEGEDIEMPFGPAKCFYYKDISITYTPDRVFDRNDA